MKLSKFAAGFGALAALIVGVGVFAQGGAPADKPAVPSRGTAHLWSEVGSFQLEGTGTARVKFVGTLLIVRAPGRPMPQVSMQGKVRQEFENEEMGRIAWFGTGEATITGDWRHLSVFGKKLDATWSGAGIATVFGEFDAAGKTGFITVDGSVPFEWLATGQTFYVPALSDPRLQQGSHAAPPSGGGRATPAPKLGS